MCDDEDVVVTRYHIKCVTGKFERAGMLGENSNAAGFPGLLHRVGVMRDKVGSVVSILEFMVHRQVKKGGRCQTKWRCLFEIM